MTSTPRPAPAPARTRFTLMDARRAGHLRRLGFTVTVCEEPERGVWIARGGLAGWFWTTAHAVRAVETGWPGERLARAR